VHQLVVKKFSTFSHMFMSGNTFFSDCTETLGRESVWHNEWSTHESMPVRIL